MSQNTVIGGQKIDLSKYPECTDGFKYLKARNRGLDFTVAMKTHVPTGPFSEGGYSALPTGSITIAATKEGRHGRPTKSCGVFLKPNGCVDHVLVATGKSEYKKIMCSNTQTIYPYPEED